LEVNSFLSKNGIIEFERTLQGNPTDIERGLKMDSNELFITQARPETVHISKKIKTFILNK